MYTTKVYKTICVLVTALSFRKLRCRSGAMFILYFMLCLFLVHQGFSNT